MYTLKLSIFFKTLAIVLGSIPAIFSQTKLMEERPPNIVWITSEDNSKHYLELFDDNGIPTPNIQSLTENGLIFNRAFSNAPVCSVARSAIITGCYGPRIGAQYHRKIVTVPMPDSLKMFPAYLRQQGYYTTNNSKEDYNIIKSDGVWDESSKKASWKNRNENQPFFHVFNIGVSHESSLHFTAKLTKPHLQYSPTIPILIYLNTPTPYTGTKLGKWIGRSATLSTNLEPMEGWTTPLFFTLAIMAAFCQEAKDICTKLDSTFQW